METVVTFFITELVELGVKAWGGRGDGAIGIGDEPELTTTGTSRGLERDDDVDLAGAGNIEASFRPGDETVVRALGGIVLGSIAGSARLETDTALLCCAGFWRDIPSTLRTVANVDYKNTKYVGL